VLQLRKHESLGGANHHWLKARHHFRFGQTGNPEHGALGALVVWNDDEVAPRTGFPMHGHRDMEIVTYVRQGLLRHDDSTGHSGEIAAGNVQALTAGHGIRHSEYNPCDTPLKLFQIWLLPRERGLEPSWTSKSFQTLQHAGELITLASGYEQDKRALQIKADARVLGATLSVGQNVYHSLHRTRHGYLVPTRGRVTVNGVVVDSGDGIAVTDEEQISISALTDTEFVLVDAA
jgi:quercetin 2,3-dioxygenase